MQRRHWIHLAAKTSLVWVMGQASLKGAWKTSDWRFQVWSQKCLDLAWHLKFGTMSPTAWQTSIDQLYRKIDLIELLQNIDFEILTKNLEFPEEQSAIIPIKNFPKSERMRLAPKLFGNRKGTAVIPHVHNDMVSVHLVLQGQFLGRTYQRQFIQEQPGTIQLKPSFTGKLNPGDWITMSDDNQNGHWLVAQKDQSFTLDIAITNLGSDRVYANSANRYSMIFCDPTVVASSSGIIHAPILSFEQAIAKFGKT